MKKNWNVVRLYNQDIGVEFGIDKCAMLGMKSGKLNLTDGIELPNQEKIRSLREKETYKYLEILKDDTKQVKMKKKKLRKKENEKATQDKTLLKK